MVRKNPSNPLDLWKLHVDHQTSLDLSQRVASSLIKQLTKTTIAHSSSRIALLKLFDTQIVNHGNVAANHLPNSMKTRLL